jgi:predicted RNA binding protein YcfA (HicA-like mRNA interferase family)
MSGITPIHWKKFEKFVLFVGCKFEREKGDHKIYSRNDLKRPVVFPHDKELPVFIIRNNLRILKIEPKEYLEILKQK